jgi:FeS assembly SUF system regulator
VLRISKLADYGTVVIAHIAREATCLHSAKDIAIATHIKRPTVNKLLKLFTKNGLLKSQSGRYGGYSLSLDAKQISLIDIIYAVEGKMALTVCSDHNGRCELESVCQIQSSFQAINHAIHDTLKNINVAHLITHLPQNETMIHFAKIDVEVR